MKKTTREWVQKAEVDYHGAATLLGGPQKAHDLVCFVSQQTAEKYLKALLEELGLVVPRTHDQIHLGDLVRPHFPLPLSVCRGLPILTRYGVSIRYPGFTTTKRQATSALRWAGKVRAACRGLLGLPAKPGR